MAMNNPHFKVVVFTPTKALFKHLGKSLTDQHLEFFYAPNISEVEQLINRVKPNLLIIHVDEESEKYLSTLQIMQTLSPIQDLWFLLLLGENLSFEKVRVELPPKRIFLQKDSNDFKEIVHNLLTIRNIEQNLSDEVNKNRFEEDINNVLRIVYQERDINRVFERLVNYLPKSIRMDYCCIFTLDKQMRHLEHFSQFIPPTHPKITGSVHSFEQIVEDWMREGVPFFRDQDEDPPAFDKLRKWGWPVTQVFFLPIHLRERNFGAILVGNSKKSPLNEQEIRLLNEVAQFISTRILDKTLAGAETQDLSSFSDQLITNHFDEGNIFQHTCKRLNEIANASSTIFWQYNKGFGFLFPKYYHFAEKDKTSGPPEKNMIFLTREHFLSQMIEKGEVRSIENVALESKLGPATIAIFQKLSYQHILVLPLKVHNEITGALIINKSQENERFSIVEIHKAEEVVRRTQNVLEDAQEVKEAQFKLKQLSRIFELGNEIKLDLSLHNKLSRIAMSVRKTLGWNDIAILLEDELGKRLRVSNLVGFKENFDLDLDFSRPIGVKKFYNFLKQCSELSSAYFYNSQVIAAANNGAEASPHTATEWQKNDLLILPLETRNKILGYMIVHDPVDRLKPTVEKISPLEFYANQAAVAVENSVLFDKLRASEERYRSLAETMSLGLVTCNQRGEIMYANPAFRKLIGVPESQVLSKKLADFFAEKSHAGLHRVLEKLAAAEKDETTRLENLEFELVSRPGEIIPVSLFGFPLYERRERAGFFLVLNDLRVIKNLERMKADFNSMIVHDLRSPMNVIQGFIELIRSRVVGEINPEQEELLDIAKENVKKVLALVDNFLVASKLEVGKFTIEPKQNNINQLIEQQVDSHRVLVKSKNLQIHMDLDRNLPPLCFDSLRIEQVLNNLFSNAIKFTPENGSIFIKSGWLERMGESEDKHFACISVQDTGAGIPNEQLERIFEKYEQVDANQGFNVRGTGLGLSICKEIVNLHNGEIWAESQPDIGSKFSFTLPVEPEYEKLEE